MKTDSKYKKSILITRHHSETYPESIWSPNTNSTWKSISTLKFTQSHWKSLSLSESATAIMSPISTHLRTLTSLLKKTTSTTLLTESSLTSLKRIINSLFLPVSVASSWESMVRLMLLVLSEKTEKKQEFTLWLKELDLSLFLYFWLI